MRQPSVGAPRVSSGTPPPIPPPGRAGGRPTSTRPCPTAATAPPAPSPSVSLLRLVPPPSGALTDLDLDEHGVEAATRRTARSSRTLCPVPFDPALAPIAPCLSMPRTRAGTRAPQVRCHSAPGAAVGGAFRALGPTRTPSRRPPIGHRAPRARCRCAFLPTPPSVHVRPPAGTLPDRNWRTA